MNKHSGTMNYVGSISILDRGDAPAQAVIDRNARSMAQRVADDTKDELEKVMTRVETIYSSFEDYEQVFGASNLEYIQDIGELEEIMKDQVKKKKYQQQVTIFIVGFSDVSGQKLRLMQQVNEFFTENSKNIEEEDWFPSTPDIDLEEVGDKIDDSLQVARDLAQHLGDLNKEMVDFMATYAEKKASNKGKKKMEKALLQAKDEVQGLAEKLQSAQADLMEKEEKLQATFKQLEGKNLEVQKFRTAAELAKQRITTLQKEVEEQKRLAEDVKRDFSQYHDEQLTALREVHQQNMEDMKKQHAEQIKSLSGVSETQSEVGRQFDLESEDGTSRQSSKQESRPSTKGRGAGLKKGGSKSGGKEGKGGRTSASGSNGEVGTQDEGGDPNAASVDEKRQTPATRHSRRSRSTLAPVEEFEDYDDVYDLTDEEAWSTVPKDQLEGRFAQYRRICQHKLREVDEQRQLTVAKTQRKVQLLKSQFVEHKTKWETERKVLISQVEQAQQLQVDAEKEADQAMTQLEDFITEQERLEEEEETQRSAILRGASGSSLSLPAPCTPGPSAPRTPLPPGTPASVQPTPPDSRNTQSSEELQNLMQQTDDAKVEELRGRVTGTKSAPPGVDMTMVAAGDAEGQTTAAAVPDRQTSDIEKNADGASSAEDATRQVILEELQDLPPIDGTPADEASTPSLHPPATAATIGSVPAHDQLETPLAEIVDPADLAKGGKDVVQGGGELKEDVSNLEKGHTTVTDGRQATDASLGERKDASSSQEEDGMSQVTADSTNASKVAQPPSKTPDAMIKVTGDVEEDLREASARSRASLRSDYKKRLEESRQAAEDRRTKSPHIKLPTNLSIDDELVLDDDDDDEFEDDIALPDDVKEELEEVRRREIWRDETATTPPPSKQPSSFSLRLAAGKWSKLLDHPILQEYLKTYHAVASFKDTLSKLFLDKDMMSASQIVSDLETLVFETDKKVMPQIEQFTSNVAFILEEIASVINSAVMVDREPPVSSLLPFSRDETRARLPPTRQDSSDLFPSFTPLPKQVTPIAAPLLPPDQLQQQQAPVMGQEPAVIMETKEPLAELEGAGDMEGPSSQAGSIQGSRKSSVSDSGTKQQLADLQSQCSQLQVQLEEESKKHEEQLRHNTVVMMEMQDTINDLQRELSAIGKTTKKPRSAASASHLSAKTPSPDQSLMFTRLDLERNAKIMKKAVLDQRLDADKYKEAVTTMDDYVSLPAQRLAHLVKKYVHHSRMKEIEENVKNSESLDEGVFDTLDKMEALQNQRARQWAEKMDSMGIERLRLAAMLMDSLDSIEQESGLFLIKPMYSYRGRELKVPPTQKLARPLRSQPVPRHQSAAHESTASFVPAPTPASNARRLDRQTPNLQMVTDYIPPPSRPEDGVVGSGAIRNIAAPPSAPMMNQPYQTWNMSVSQTRSPMDSLQHSLNTPRMLELDINRMLIGQNNVSTKLPHPPTDDRLVNASNNSLRSYVTVQRPAASLAAERPPSAQGGRDTGAPPSSPSPRPPVAISPADRDLPHAITSPPPLPPIGDRSLSALSSHPDEPEPPHSPPGSSMYQSTTHDQEEGNVLKSTTRASSQVSLLGEDDQ